MSFLERFAVSILQKSKLVQKNKKPLVSHLEHSRETGKKMERRNEEFIE